MIKSSSGNVLNFVDQNTKSYSVRKVYKTFIIFVITMMSGIRIIICLFAILLINCNDAPDFPLEPVLTFVGLSNIEMVQSDLPIDSTIIFLEFTDGDGNLGDKDSLNVFVTDLRDQFVAGKFRIPLIDEIGSNNGISGEIMLTMYTTCCIYPTNQSPCTPSETFPTDTVQYEIYIVDRAGNESNRVQTSPIVIRCDQ